MNTANTTLERVNSWIRNSVSLKLFIIILIMLLLLIPSEMIKSIISEREELRFEAIREVSSKWAENQLINGPILSIPVLFEHEEGNKKIQEIKYLKILPDILRIKGKIIPTRLKRGIFEVIVYRSEISLNGSFDLNKKFVLNETKLIQYEQAFLTLGISDLRGIEEEINLKWENQDLKVESGSKLSPIINSGITAYIREISNDTCRKYDFQLILKLQGSQNLSFIPVGNTTFAELESAWTSPSFNGSFLPDWRELTEGGFKASWKILEMNRNFPQYWIEPDPSQYMANTTFGIDLVLPVDDYQKSMRSAKYAVLTIVLTFLIFFLAEILNGRKIHPFQYGLVGLALCLFYILLVSLSEHLKFNLAYLISTFAIITMIVLYSVSVFRKIKLSLVLFVMMISIYGFLFITLQLADYALLLGSIGLTVILGLTMYFTRNINWYQLNVDNE
ncbi:MAG: cell envelope integrity protein CreD [Cyclobacteriaceae bacterium]|nr:cell envelope integrity protein CreD [Cyclobacteriaceae bacterium]